MKHERPPKIGDQSELAQGPAGVIDDISKVATGIYWVGAPGHSGYWLDSKRLARVLAKFPELEGVGYVFASPEKAEAFRAEARAQHYFEEDLEWAYVELTFPEISDRRSLAEARKVYNRWLK